MTVWAGKMLIVNLSQGKFTKEPTPLDLVEKYLGGAGLGAYFLYKLVPPKIKADSPENWVILGAGPFNGTIIPANGRLSANTLSPVTGIYTDSSSGGDFAPELKFAGYDYVLITGKADRPVYLWIDGDNVELREATHLMGKTTWEADELIRKELGDWRIKTALTGPAAQNGVLYGALVINKYRVLGKSGVGSVFARKNLLGVAVRGRKTVSLYDPSSYEKICEKILASMKSSQRFASFSVTGTSYLVDLYQETGRLVVKNRQDGKAPDELYKKISTDSFLKDFKVRDIACFNCPIHCSHWVEVKEGRFKGERGEKLELVAFEAFGSLLGNYDLGAICHFQNECNRYGLDMMECGNTLAMAFEAYERGLVTTEDTDGIPLEWGNLDSIERAFQKIVNFEGFGKILGLGVKQAAQKIGRGVEQYAIEVKGYGMSMVEVRNAPHWGLAFATASRGGDHCKALPAVVSRDPELIKDLFGDQTPEEVLSLVESRGKGKVVAWFENYCAVVDSLGLCKLAYMPGLIHPKDLAPALTFATGVRYDYDRLMECGERIYNVEKAFNARLGLTRKDDTLPRRILEEPIPTGPRKGKHLGTVLPGMLNEYYEARGWDEVSGIQTRSKLEGLGLKEIADELEETGNLANY